MTSRGGVGRVCKAGGIGRLVRISIAGPCLSCTICTLFTAAGGCFEIAAEIVVADGATVAGPATAEAVGVGTKGGGTTGTVAGCGGTYGPDDGAGALTTGAGAGFAGVGAAFGTSSGCHAFTVRSA